MSELYQQILEKYQTRKTRAQKTEFIALLWKNFPQMRVETSGLMRSRNLIVGDIQRAQVIFTAHYDTCAVSLLPNLILPRRTLIKALYMLLYILPYFALMVAANFALLALGLPKDTRMLIILAVYWAAFIAATFLGKPNSHTANDNTSGVLTLCGLIRRLSPEEMSRAAFVFFDNEEYGCLGSGAFYKRHKELMAGKLIFNLDCVGDGDHFMFVMTRPARKKWEARIMAAFPGDARRKTVFEDAKKARYSSDQKHFPVSVAVAALRPHKFLDLHTGRIHTSRDTVCDPENLEFLICGAQNLVRNLES